MYRILLILSLCSGCAFTSLEDAPPFAPEDDMDMGVEPDDGGEVDADMGSSIPEACLPIDLEARVAARAIPRVANLGDGTLFGAWNGSSMEIRAIGDTIETIGSPPGLEASADESYDISGQLTDSGLEILIATIRDEALIVHRCNDQGCDQQDLSNMAEYSSSVDIYQRPDSGVFFVGGARGNGPSAKAPDIVVFQNGFDGGPTGVMVSQARRIDGMNVPGEALGNQRIRIAPAGMALMQWNIASVNDNGERIVVSGEGGIPSQVCGMGDGKVVPVPGEPAFLLAQDTPDGEILAECRFGEMGGTPRSEAVERLGDFDLARGMNTAVIAWVDGNTVRANTLNGDQMGPVVNLYEGREVTNIAVDVSPDSQKVRFFIVDEEQAYLLDFETEDLADCF